MGRVYELKDVEMLKKMVEVIRAEDPEAVVKVKVNKYWKSKNKEKGRNSIPSLYFIFTRFENICYDIFRRQ